MANNTQGTESFIRHHASSDELRRYVRAKSGSTVIISFSCGKDAIAAWLALRPHFERIIPFYLYLVPGLEFVEEGLSYFERFFGTKIYRFPQPNLYRMLKDKVFQPPERAVVLRENELTPLTYDEIEATVRLKSNAPTAFMATGVRAADSPVRHASVKKHGALNPTRRTFFPVFDWRIADVHKAIHSSKIRLPVDYRLFGRTFDGIDERFLWPVKKYYPRDYEQILKWFPLADLMLHRRTFQDRGTGP